jgi:hypothetical protein
MTDLDTALAEADAWPPPDPVEREPRKCRRHQWVMYIEDTRDLQTGEVTDEHLTGLRCVACGRPKDPAASRRGKNNRSRGNSIERDVCKALGIARRGQYGGPDDGGGEADWITVQVKSGGAYPERIDGLLRALPLRASQLRGVVHVDTPGAGTRRRALITLDLEEFSQWYGTR